MANRRMDHPTTNGSSSISPAIWTATQHGGPGLARAAPNVLRAVVFKGVLVHAPFRVVVRARLHYRTARVTRAALVQLRLRNQQLMASTCRTPLDVVTRLGAVQAQDYGAATWGLGLRAPGLRDADVHAAFDAGAILRTHVLRPTWHFVPPADIRWMLALSAPRIRAAAASYLLRLGLDVRTRKRSRSVIARALAGGRFLTRRELTATLGRAGLRVDGLRPNFLLMDAEIEGVICSGPRRGKQFTYARLDTRVPPHPPVDRADALGRLARVYFASHGPAAFRDFLWWSGLAAADARAAIETIASSLERERVNNQDYWLLPSSVPGGRRSPLVQLLPNFDEYLVAYQDRSPIAADPRTEPLAVLGYVILVNGCVAGTWRRTIGPGRVAVEIRPSHASRPAMERSLRSAAAAYGRFLERPVECTIRC